MQLNKIEETCCFYRPDIDKYILYGEDVILFKNSDQAMQFISDFPMFFCEANCMIVKAKDHFKNIHLGTVDYDEIADKMEEEKEYQARKIEARKEELKDE